MTWRDEVLQGSFRGVPFEVEGAESEAGRKKVVVEIPGRDVPFVQDLGAATQAVRLEGFVLGADYLAKRDALLAALREPGQGELVHPWYGARVASVTDVRVRESNREGGMARFSMRFVLEAEEVALVAAADAISTTERAASSLRDAAGASVGGQVKGLRSNLRVREARFEAQGVTRSFEQLVRFRSQQLDGNLDSDQVGGLFGELGGLADSTLRDGDDFTIWIQTLQGGAATFGNGFTGRADAFRSLLDFVQSLLTDESTPARDAVRLPVASSLVAEAAVQAAQVGSSWESRQEAVEARTQLLEAMGKIQERADDLLAEGLADMRAATASAVPDPSVELPELGRYVPPDTQPALVASSRVYGTPDRDEEIARRNGVRHPGFLSGQTPLEVLIGA